MSAAAFRSAVEQRDLAAMTELLAPGVTFLSPVSHKPFEGRDVVSFVLGHVLEVFEDFHYVDELHSEGSYALIFRARVRDRQVDGLDLVGEDAEGLIEHLTVMVRPLSGLNALAEEMGRRLSQGR